MGKKLDLQKEILEELVDYSDKLADGINTVVEELREGRKKDTDDLFNLVIQGINWEIEVFNNCEELINSDETRVNKESMAAAVARLGKVLQERDDIKIAACLDVDFLPFVKSMELAGQELIL